MPVVNPVPVTYTELIERAKKITLPDFQRSLVWTDTQKKELLFSTLLGFPIGAICVARDNVDGSPSSYLLDGQQRLDCIKDLVNPYIASSWINIKKPNFFDEPTDTELRDYYENMLWSQIYEFLGIDFYNSDEYNTFISTSDYKALDTKLKDYNSKNEQAKANKIKKQIAIKEYHYREKWLLEYKGGNSNLPKDGYLRQKNTLVSRFFSIYYHHRLSSTTLEDLILHKKRFKRLSSNFDLGATLKTHNQVLEALLDNLEEVAHNTSLNDEDKISTFLDLIFETKLEKKDLTAPEDLIDKKSGEELSEEKKSKEIEKWYGLYRNQLFGKSNEKLKDYIQYFKDRRLYKYNITEHKLSILEFTAEEGRILTEEELTKVFFLVNQAGMALTHIEILACRPGWREKLSLDINDNVHHKKLFDKYREISPNMGLHKRDEEYLSNDIFNKWHIASGLGAVLLKSQTDEEANWIMKVPSLPDFPDNAPLKPKDKQKFNEKRKNSIADLSKFGFQLLSLLSTNKVDTPTWSQLQLNDDVQWKDVIEKVDHLRSAGQILKQDDFFKNILQWSDTIEQFFANNLMATRAFLKIMYDEYIAIVSVQNNIASRKEYIFRMRRLFDYTLYTVVTGWWVGSAEQKITDFITDYDHIKIQNEVTSDKWEDLLKEMCDNGTINNRDYHKDTTRVSKDYNLKIGEPHKSIIPILQYKFVLSEVQKNVSIPVAKQDVYKLHLDHIIPKESWKKYLEPYKQSPYDDLPSNNFTHHICNLTLLGYDSNCAKGNNPIDVWWSDMKSNSEYTAMIKEQLTNWADLPDSIEKLQEMNEPSKFENLSSLRRAKFVEVFSKSNRNKYLFEQA